MKKLVFAAMVCLTLCQSGAQDKVDFHKQIRPLLENHCFECHGPEKTKGKLRLDQKDFVFKRDHPVISPGNAEKSDLYRLITLPKGHDDIMPPKGEPLSKAETDLIRDWINQGAEWPDQPPQVASPAPQPAPSGTTADELRAAAAELRSAAARLEAAASMIESGSALAQTPPVIPSAPAAPVIAEKPSEAELKAIAEVQKLGVPVMPIAQNERGRSANFRQLGTNVTDETVALLKEMVSLVDLNLATTRVTDAGLAHLAGLTNLTVLHLENTGITDAGLEHLKGLVHLRYLNLYGTGVTDAGLEHLKGLASLGNLYLWQTKVTDAGEANLQKALPNVKINRGIDLAPATPEEKKEENAEEKKAGA
jgi:hypothetical protein